MVNKIVALLENPLFSKTFKDAILTCIKVILEDHQNDLTEQKKLFDQLIRVINNHLDLELKTRKLELELVELKNREDRMLKIISSFEQAVSQLENVRKESAH